MAGMEAGQDVERPCLPARPLRAGRSCNPGPSLPAVPDGCPETRCRAAAEGGPPDGPRLGCGAAQGSALAVLRPDSACRLLGGGSAAPGNFDFNENSARAHPSAADASPPLPKGVRGHSPAAAET